MTEQVLQLLDAARRLPYHQRISPLQQAVTAANETGDEQLAYRARFDLLTACCLGGEAAGTFGLFAWLLQRYDASPEWLGPNERRALLWAYKWMITSLVDFPQVSLAQLQNTLADLERHYLAAGEGLEPARDCGYSLASHVRGRAAAQPEFEAWQALPRTHLSDCHACQANRVVSHLAAQGRYADAVAAAAPVLEGQISCAEQPAMIMSELLVPLLEIGRAAEAAQYHLKSWREASGDPNLVTVAATHIEVCARSGALLRGIELADRTLAGIERYESPWVELRVAAALARLGDECGQAGLGDQPIRTAGGQTTIAELGAERRGRAFELAALFDKRNGTDAISRSVHETLTAHRLPPLSLGVLGAPATPEIDWQQPSQHPAAPGLVGIDRLDLPGLAQHLEEARRWGSEAVQQAVLAEWQRRRPGLAQATHDRSEQLAIAALDYALARLQQARLDPDFPATAWQAIDRYRNNGAEVEAALAHQWLALTGDDLNTARELLDQVLADGDLTQRARALSRWLARYENEADEEREYLARLRALGIDLTAPPAAREAFATGLCYTDASSPEEQLAATYEAQLLLPDDEFPTTGCHLLGRRGSILRVLERPDDAAAAEAQALALAERSRSPRGYGGSLMMQAGWAQIEGEYATAEELIGRAIRAFEALPDILPVLDSRLRLVGQFLGTGQLLQAAELGEATLAMVPTEVWELPSTSKRAKLSVARLVGIVTDALIELGEQDRALHLTERSLPLFAELDEPAMAASVHHQRSQLLSESEPAEALRSINLSIELAERAEAWRLLLVGKRERYWLVQRLDGLDAGLAALADSLATLDEVETSDLVDPKPDLRGWDFDAEADTQRLDGVRMLAMTDDPAQWQRALAELDGLPDQMLERRGPQTYVLSAFDLRGTLLLLTDQEQAGLAELERAAKMAVQSGDQIWQRMAARGAQWLDRQGRSAEAQEFWGRIAPRS